MFLSESLTHEMDTYKYTDFNFFMSYKAIRIKIYAGKENFVKNKI